MMKYIKDYPRPQFIREDWENLNGKWNFAFDDNNEGESKKYYMNFPVKNTINVPFTYETNLSGINDESIHYTVWYNKKINIGEKKLKEKIILHFEGSDYITKVWVNGNYIGVNEGGYSRFSFEIEKFIKEGENDITVKVQDSLSKEQPRGKQRYKKESWKCWYIQTTGIWKTVWLEYVPMNYIKRVKITPDLDAKKIKLEYDTNISEEELKNNEFIIETEISFKGKILNKTETLLESSNDNNETQINVIKEWSTKMPNLYDITYKLYCNGKIVDIVYSYFGLRKISIQNGKIFLNNEELYLKLVLDQGYWKESHLTPISEDAIIKDIDIVLKYGYNGIRKHQKK